jgi:hypothetical protein
VVVAVASVLGAGLSPTPGVQERMHPVKMAERMEKKIGARNIRVGDIEWKKSAYVRHCGLL